MESIKNFSSDDQEHTGSASASRKAISVPIFVYNKIGTPATAEPRPNSYVSLDRFSFQMEWLANRGYQTISPKDFWGIRKGFHQNAPAKPILITFDDASETVYSNAYPILRKYGFNALVFMVATAFGRPASWDGETDVHSHRLLTLDQLRSLLRHGWHVGSHSLTHSQLTKCDPEIIAREVQESKQLLEEKLGSKVDWFAYPFGDFNDASRSAVRQAGYKLAFATEQGDGDDFSIARRTITGRTHLLRFFWRLLRPNSFFRVDRFYRGRGSGRE